MVFSKSNACLGYSFDWNVFRVGNKMEIQKKIYKPELGIRASWF